MWLHTLKSVRIVSWTVNDLTTSWMREAHWHPSPLRFRIVCWTANDLASWVRESHWHPSRLRPTLQLPCQMIVRLPAKLSRSGTWPRELFRASNGRCCSLVGTLVLLHCGEQGDRPARNHHLRNTVRVHGKEAKLGQIFGMGAERITVGLSGSWVTACRTLATFAADTESKPVRMTQSAIR
jgi:hypothetical protein